MNKTIIDEIHETREYIWESVKGNIDNFVKLIIENENKHKNRLVSKISTKLEVSKESSIK